VQHDCRGKTRKAFLQLAAWPAAVRTGRRETRYCIDYNASRFINICWAGESPPSVTTERDGAVSDVWMIEFSRPIVWPVVGQQRKGTLPFVVEALNRAPAHRQMELLPTCTSTD